MESPGVLIKLSDLGFTPTGADHEILSDINLEIRAGDFLLLLGSPGSGKTMLTYCFNGLVPHITEGELRGVAMVKGMDTSTHKIHEMASVVGMVFQNPDDQIISLKVQNEVAWGVENLGLPHSEIVKRVKEFMSLLGISGLWDRLTFAISGGQKQKVSIASNLAMLQDVLVLDDPTTDLDPVCKAEVVEVLARLHREAGKTLVVIEHDLNDFIEMANRVVVMDKGRILYDMPPGELFTKHYDELERLGVNIPQHIEIAHAAARAGAPGSIPTHKEEAFAQVESYLAGRRPLTVETSLPVRPTGEPVISLKDVEFSYQKGVPVLRGISADIRHGEFVAIVGANGSGKSTLVKTLTGLLVPDKGDVIVQGKNTRQVKAADLVQDLGYVFQNPDDQLFTGNVTEEVAFSLRIRHLPEEEVAKRVAEVLETVGLSDVRDKHPFALSRGQRQKLAVATALVHKPSIMLLDEPTTGQDRKSLAGLLGLMARFNKEGNTTVMITHDMDIVSAFATRVLVMVEGQFLLDGDPVSVFYDHYDTLRQLNLRPPTVVNYCRRLQGRGVPRYITAGELARYITEVA